MADIFARFPRAIGTKGTRFESGPYAKVRVVGEALGLFEVEVVAGSLIAAGQRRWVERDNIYASPAELDYFRRLIEWFHGKGDPVGDRPVPAKLTIEGEDHGN